MTFKELDTLINNIADSFYDRGEIFFRIVMHHGINQIAAMLAVLKSGAAHEIVNRICTTSTKLQPIVYEI